jgi:hypothetical protein
VRQVGDTVWWLGLSHDRGQTFANVLQGTIHRLIPLGPGLTVQSDWADIPLGGLRGNGSLKLHGQPFLGTSPITLDKLSFTGGFGAANWEKLYDPVVVERGPA